MLYNFAQAIREKTLQESGGDTSFPPANKLLENFTLKDFRILWDHIDEEEKEDAEKLKELLEVLHNPTRIELFHFLLYSNMDNPLVPFLEKEIDVSVLYEQKLPS